MDLRRGQVEASKWTMCCLLFFLLVVSLCHICYLLSFLCVKEIEFEAQRQPIHDLAWAPAMGRSFHLVASASRERCFHIHTLLRQGEGASPSEVWRVAWNCTGTVLATSAEDGTLSLWRRDFSEQWVNVQNLPLVGTPLASVYRDNS